MNRFPRNQCRQRTEEHGELSLENDRRNQERKMQTPTGKMQEKSRGCGTGNWMKVFWGREWHILKCCYQAEQEENQELTTIFRNVEITGNFHKTVLEE